MNIVLYQPDIAGNTGSIGRTCLALDISLHLIKPYGFDLSEKKVRRAGLDYWKHVKLHEYDNLEMFFSKNSIPRESLYFFTKRSDQVYYSQNYKRDCFLVFGSETKALPFEELVDFEDRFFSLPQLFPHIRSLNLANCATAVAYEAHRCLSNL
jgi:tRNA (cytidine/uridine-2'-O-)-methyltransferase